MIHDAVNQLLAAFAQGQTEFDQILIKNANLQAQFLPFIRLRAARMSAADFRHAILPGADFEGAVLRQANCSHANLLAAQLAWADLSQADLSNTLLARANLVGANLANANLAGASLSGADLSSANLRNANLTGANLKGANLSKANLFGARIDAKALADAILEFTVMPDGQCLSPPSTPSSTVPVKNLISYTRLATAITHQREQPAPEPPTDPTDDFDPATPSTPANSSAAASFTPPRHVWFRPAAMPASRPPQSSVAPAHAIDD